MQSGYQAANASLCFFADEFDFIAVRIGYECDNCVASFHGPCLADNGASALADFFGGLIDIIYFDGDVAKAAA